MVPRYQNSALSAAAFVSALVVLGAESSSIRAAQPVSRDLALSREFRTRTWTTAEGLPSNEIRCLAQTRDGYLWIGTSVGLTRFDGFRFHFFHPLDCVSLAEDRAGTLWIGARSGLFKLRDREIEPVALGYFGPPDQLNVVVCPRRAGGIWAAMRNKVMSVTELGVEKTMSTPGLITTLLEDHSGYVWAVSEARELWRWNPSDLAIEFEQPIPSASGSAVHALLQDSKGYVWCGVGGLPFGIRLYRWDSNGLERFVPNSEDNLGIITTLAEGRRGTIWAGGNLGLWRLQDERLENVAEAAPGYVSSLLRDREDNLWIGTQNGLYCLDRVPIGQLTEGLPNPNVRAILEANDGSMWFGTAAGVARLTNGQFESFPNEKSPSLGPDVICLAQDRAGTIWAGLREPNEVNWSANGIGPVRSFMALQKFLLPPFGDPAGFFNVPLTNDFQPAPVTSLAPAPDGKLYVIHRDELVVLQTNGWPRESTVEALPAPVRFAFLDRKSNLWVSGAEVFRKSGGEWTRFGAKDGLDQGLRAVVHEDENGALWLVSERQGVLRFKDGKFQAITTAHGLPSDLTFSLLEDDFGRYWFNSDQGIFWARKKDLNAVAGGRQKFIDCVRFGTAGPMGLGGNHWNMASAFKSRDGKLWFPTAKGAAIVNPISIAADHTVPVAIDEVEAGGQILYIKEKKLGRSGGQDAGLDHARELLVPPGLDRSLIVRFTAISLSSPERMRVRFRLLGRDEDWTEAPPHQRIIHLGQVSPGRYKFQLGAAAPHGLYNSEPAELSLYISPSFHETRTFYGLCTGLLGAAGALLAYRWRVQRRIARLEREAAVAHERERIARDLHDDVGSSLTRIALLSQVARRDSAILENAASNIEKIAAISGEVVDNISEVIWAANPKYDNLESLAGYLREYAAEYLDASRIGLRFNAQGGLPARSLTGEFRRQVFLVFKEALNNIAKHAEATQVEVDLRLDSGWMLLSISDNGKGMRPASNGGCHHGLDNMRERVTKLGGAFDFESRTAQGVKIEIRVPLPKV